mgnify:CR=1 FL=1
MSKYLLLVFLLGSCAQSPTWEDSNSTVRGWGSMREALKMGHSEGRVVLDDVIGERTYGLGAMAGLQGEITIIHGTSYIVDASSGELTIRPHTADDEATLLVTADVSSWHMYPVPEIGSYEELEEVVAELCRAKGMDLQQPIPFWVQGVATEIELHVINGSCPIANPDGPEPWRTAQETVLLRLFGIYIEGSAGEFTHHNRNSHVHAIATGSKISGHVDAIALSDQSVIWIPELP